MKRVFLCLPVLPERSQFSLCSVIRRVKKQSAKADSMVLVSFCSLKIRFLLNSFFKEKSFSHETNASKTHGRANYVLEHLVMVNSRPGHPVRTRSHGIIIYTLTSISHMISGILIGSDC